MVQVIRKLFSEDLSLLIAGFFLFEHIVLLLSFLIDYFVPDVPTEVLDRAAKTKYQALR
eukprot:SAG11_NODE_14969_length_593_cov_0.732794_1_plen_58_part_10